MGVEPPNSSPGYASGGEWRTCWWPSPLDALRLPCDISTLCGVQSLLGCTGTASDGWLDHQLFHAVTTNCECRRYSQQQLMNTVCSTTVSVGMQHHWSPEPGLCGSVRRMVSVLDGRCSLAELKETGQRLLTAHNSALCQCMHSYTDIGCAHLIQTYEIPKFVVSAQQRTTT